MIKFKVLLVYPNLMLVTQLPNNIAQLAGCLIGEGREVRLFDTTLYHTAEKSNDDIRVERMQVRPFNLGDCGVTLKENNVYGDFIKLVDDYRPDLIAVSVLDDTVKLGTDLINRLDSKHKSIPVIFGGVHAFFNAGPLIKNENIDMVCIGEGEVTLRSVCSGLKNKLPLKGIPNLWHKEDSGKIIKNHLGEPVDINTLPYEDFSIFEEQRFYRPMQGRIVKSLPLNFDRGCPHQCTFCGAPAISKFYRDANYPRYYRQKSLERIYKEIKHQLGLYDVEYLYFNSETFLSMPEEKLRDFSRMYSKFRLPFWCQTSIETVTEGKIKILKEMNCDRISVGIEHGNEKFRHVVLKKKFSNSDVIRAFNIFNKYEIKVGINNIIGFPDETRELIFDTIRLNRQVKADSINGFIFQPYIGTELRRHCLQKGYLSDDTVTDTLIGDPVLNMPQISKDELKGLLRTFVLYVKMPESYYPKIKTAEQLNKRGDCALSELREVFFKKYFQ